MAPGLNGRQTGTVPKNKSRGCGPPPQRLPCEPFIHSIFLEWEHMSEGGQKNQLKKNSSPSCSETEADSLRQELGRSRSSTMTSLNGNREGCSQDSFSKVNVPDRKQVANKLGQIQNYVQQTTALMNSLKASDSPASQNQYQKLSVMLEDLKDSEKKLSSLLSNMDSSEFKLDSLLDADQSKGNNGEEADEEELARRSRESKKKLEVLQKRKQDLLKLQEKAKKQLQKAQAEQSRLVARASSLNQELNANKIMGLNVQQLNQRLKTVQEMYNTRDQIVDTLGENRRGAKVKTNGLDEDQTEMSDTETDLQLVADKMEELDAMKAQLGQIQKIMASITSMQNSENGPQISESDDSKEKMNFSSQNSSFTEGLQNGEDGNNNLMKLEQAKTKLSHLSQLLEVVQSAQNTPGLSPSYLQLVSNLMNEEVNSFAESPSPGSSIQSPQRNSEEVSVQTMKVMTKELEETTAAMKEERDRLMATRQELQGMAKRLPLIKSEADMLSPDCDSESEPPCLKPATLEAFQRGNLNELAEAEQSPNCNDISPYIVKPAQTRNKQCRSWNSQLPNSNSTSQDRRSKNDSLSRASNQSSRGGSRALSRDQPQWCPSPSVSYYNERSSALTESQQQLEMSGNLCEIMLSESLQREMRPNDISLQEMFAQHQLLTRTVAQCSQLLWLQQKQIVELRNAFMLQCRSFPIQTLQSNQSHLNVPPLGNPLIGTSSLNPIQIPPVAVQQHQNFSHPLYPNVKLNSGDLQSQQQDFPEQFMPNGNQTSMHFPSGFGWDIRPDNFNRFNPTVSNVNPSFQQNLSSGFNNRGPNGMNSVVPEDSGALNNQVPPGNRANNYWDNFRSYSRQNLLSNTKSNEDFEQSRRYVTTSAQDRSPRDAIPSSLQNNQSMGAPSQQPPFAAQGNCELVSNDQFLLPPSQNTRGSHHSQVARSFSSEVQNQRNQGKNESRHHDNESRYLNAGLKNEGSGSGRSRVPEFGPDIRSVRNDVGQGSRNTDNLNSSRNFMQFVRDIDNEETAHGNNKKRPERCRNDGVGNLNNRGYHNTSLWENVYSEVSNFIRANESRPHFLLQLFRDLQNVTTDSLRQRTLVSIQETVTANNLTERTSNMSGGNVNIIENRNNIRESRSNLNRNQTEDPSRIDELFCHLRENQNTIRQNIGMSNYLLGGNLENPNISNIRDLRSSRNNLESEDLRDLRTYFEANLCNFGHNSALENPNLSNIRENLTRRGMSDMENIHPKNVYMSIYDNASELRRRNQESSNGHQFASHFRNFEVENDYLGNEISGNCENLRESNNHFELESNFEGAVGGRVHFQQENRATSSGFSVHDTGDNFVRSRQFLGNGNDSGIDINFNNDERKRGFAEGDSNINDGAVKSKKCDISDVEGAVALRGEWDRNDGRESSFDSSLNHSRKEMSSPFIPMCDNSFFHCRTFQQSDNGDLAEADQSRNEETSGAESDSGFINSQIVEPGIPFSPERNRQSGENFSSQNVPEAERTFIESKNCESECNTNDSSGGGGAEGESNSGPKPETSALRGNDGGSSHRKNDSEGFYYQLNPSTSGSESSVPKSGVKHRKRADEAAERECSGDFKKISCKNSTNKFRDSAFSQGKHNCTGLEESTSRKADSDSVSSGSAVDGRQSSEGGRDIVYYPFQLSLENNSEVEKRNISPEAESDWECSSGLDQVPTRLNKSGSSVKSEDSGGSVP